MRDAKKKNQKVMMRHVCDYLATQDSYTLHKPLRHKYPRDKVVASGIDSDWQIDLIDMRNLPHANRKHKFILSCIDVFSKKGWLVAMLTKHPKDSLEAFI